MTAIEVLRRYKDEDLPAFVGIPLEDVNQIGNSGDRPLHVACIRGNMEEIRALVKAGADVNAQGEMANTPLHECVGQGHYIAAQFLLACGASPELKNEWGDTPVDVARLKGSEDIIKLLTRRAGGTA
jgi:ankyrin repeat protein